MKRCEFQKSARRYAEGELTPAEAGALRLHLKKCAACSKLVEETRRMATAFEKMDRARPSSELKKRIFAEISRGNGGANKRIDSGAVVLMCRRIGAAAACMFVIFGSLVLFNLGADAERNGGVDSSITVSAKDSAEYYPLSALDETDRSFLSGDVADAYEALYGLPQ